MGKPPKSVKVNVLWGKNDVRTAIEQFYTPKKLLYPQNKFLAMPLSVIAYTVKLLIQAGSLIQAGGLGNLF